MLYQDVTNSPEEEERLISQINERLNKAHDRLESLMGLNPKQRNRQKYWEVDLVLFVYLSSLSDWFVFFNERKWKICSWIKEFDCSAQSNQ